MDRGGAETRSLEILRRLDRNAVHSVYCALSPNLKKGSLDDEIRALGGEVIEVPLGRGFGRRFRTALREYHITAMHGHVAFVSGLLCYYAWRERVPVRIVHWHSTGETNRPFVKRLQDFVLRLFIKLFATHIVSVGEAAMQSNWPQYKNDSRARILFNGVDPARFDCGVNSLKTRHELGIAEAALVFVHVGRFHESKNQIRLVEIFAEARKLRPDARLVLIGKGENEYEKTVRQIAERLGVSDAILFLGLVENVAEYLPIGNIGVSPSLFEGLPGAVLEALAAGLPVLASDIPPMLELQGQLKGITTLSLDETNRLWAEKAIDLAAKHASAESRRQISADLFASRYSLDACVSGHMEIWQGKPNPDRQ